ncbi:hypothetical protein Tco_0449491 [Tanacetum coccineum]
MARMPIFQEDRSSQELGFTRTTSYYRLYFIGLIANTLIIFEQMFENASLQNSKSVIRNIQDIIAIQFYDAIDHTQEDHSNQTQALNSDSLKVDLVVKQNSCSEKEDSNSETASSKSAKECSLNSETQDVHAIKYKMSKAKERCMAYFRSLHSHLQVLSKGDLKGTRIEHGFKREFMSLFGQDIDTFTSTMLLNVDQLQKQLDKDEFQEDGSMAAFWVVNNQFQKFIDSKFTLDYDSQMTDTYFVDLHGNRFQVSTTSEIHYSNMGNVKKVRCERTVIKDSLKEGPTQPVQDDYSTVREDTNADDADIRPFMMEEPMA